MIVWCMHNSHSTMLYFYSVGNLQPTLPVENDQFVAKNLYY